MNTLKSLLKPVASLRLTVGLLVAAMVLIFAGTLAQREQGIWQVQHQYFHSWMAWIPFQNLLPFVEHKVPHSFPFIGGYTLIAVMLANLLTAHSLRFKGTWKDLIFLPLLAISFGLGHLWQYTHSTLAAGLCVVGAGLATAMFLAALGVLHGKRSGVILIHLGLILVLGGELITSRMASESQMRIDEGQTVRYSFDIREYELAVVDPSPGDVDNAVVIAEKRLHHPEAIHDARLPFDLTVVKYYPNSSLLGPMQKGDGDALATAGTVNGLPAKGVKVAGKPRVTGTEGQNVDAASAFVNVSKDGRDLGTYLVSLFLDDPQKIDVGGKTYELSLRFKRLYKPYSVTLLKFSHDRFKGTETARNFSALIRLVDPARNEDREVLIKMNSPLRYGGETFYQQSFDEKTDKTTVLQVVSNPGWLMPYEAIVIGAVGMAVHFGIHLVSFLGRRKKEALAQSIPFAGVVGPRRGTPPQMPASGKPKGGGKRQPEAYTLQPSRGPTSPAFFVPALLALVCFAIVCFTALPHGGPAKWDLAGFGEVPVNFEGRVMPLDSLARNSLKVLSNYESTSEPFWIDQKDGTELHTIAEAQDRKDQGHKLKADKTTVPAVEWLAEVLGSTERAESLEVFRIDNDDVRNALGLPDERELPDGHRELRKYYSVKELRAVDKTLGEQFARANAIPDANHTLVQKKVVELARHIMLYQRLSGLGTLYVVPPLEAGQEWRTLTEVVKASREKLQQDPTSQAERDPGAVAFVSMVDAYRDNKPAEFRAAVGDYQRLLDAKLPAVTRKSSFESFLNRFSPFTTAWVFYVIAFVLVALSWLGWSRPLARGAVAVVLVALGAHAFGLVARMYIAGRPPVTNLYSSAVFIGFGGVLVGLVLERIFRNTLGTSVAAIMGFLPLLVAGGIATSDAARGQADTMSQLQAVLDTNFWLATHVVCITIGYLATFVAGLLGTIYIVGGVLTPAFDATARKDMSRMAYGIVCFAMLFSFVGTILGGIWADQSWGRFWGWDPKENGAILIVLWNALILHARWCGLARERGIMLLAVFGNIVTAWSWFGTNMLGVGLHSYGFMEHALFWLGLFVTSQLLLIAVGNLPFTMWRSHAGGPSEATS